METQKTTNRGKGKTSTIRHNNTILVDVDKMCAIIKEKGYTPTKVTNIVGITPSSYWNWKHNGGYANADSVKRIAKLLGVSVNDLCVDTTNIKTVGDTSNTSESDVKPVEGVNSNHESFKTIGETQNVHTLFDIVNTNVMTLSNVLINYIDSKFDALYGQLHKDLLDLLTTRDNATNDGGDIIIEDTTKQKPMAFIVNSDEVNALLNGYDENDSYESYRNKINRMVGICASYSRVPHKTILHGAYIEMTNIYGVVYKQLKKEYFEKYQHVDGGSTELIYENPIFRQIFYNMISDKLKSVTIA